MYHHDGIVILILEVIPHLCPYRPQEMKLSIAGQVTIFKTHELSAVEVRAPPIQG